MDSSIEKCGVFSKDLMFLFYVVIVRERMRMRGKKGCQLKVGALEWGHRCGHVNGLHLVLSSLPLTRKWTFNKGMFN